MQQFQVSPSQITLQVEGIGFFAPGTPSNKQPNTIQPVSGCSVTYDRTKGSLSQLASCTAEVPTGTYGGLIISYSTTYNLVVNDPQAGFYSDPSSPNFVSITPPAGGAAMVQLRDQNGGNATGYKTTLFSTPVTFTEKSSPQFSVIFDPTHWLVVPENSGAVTGPMYFAGDPPIAGTLGQFGKAVYYTNVGTTGGFAPNGPNSVGFIVFFTSDGVATQVSLRDGPFCSGSVFESGAAFAGNGTNWGEFGYLGLDSNNVLSWDLGGALTPDQTQITGYAGVVSVPMGTKVGDTVTAQYACTASPPTPSSGTTFASGAPSFTPTGSVSLTLLEL
jgi:hypothetical protein